MKNSAFSSAVHYPWPEIIKLFPTRESLASDIQAGDGKITNLFLQFMLYTKEELESPSLNTGGLVSTR